MAQVSLPALDVPETLLLRRAERGAQRLADLFEHPAILEDLSLDEFVESWGQLGWDDGFERLAALEQEVARLEITPEETLRASIQRRFGSTLLHGLGIYPTPRCPLESVWIEPVLLQTHPNVSALLAAMESSPDTEHSVGELLQAKCALVIGGAGAGKSTLLQRIALDAARRGPSWPTLRDVFPLVVLARSLPNGALTLDEVARQNEADPNYVQALLRSGLGLLLIDGVDEAPTSEKATVLEQARALAGASPLIVSMRPSLDPHLDLRAFTTFRVGSFAPPQVDECIRVWSRALERAVQSDIKRADEEAALGAEDLITRVRRNDAISDLAKTPLLCATLTLLYRFMGNRIPEQRIALYEAWSNLLLHEWDRAKLAQGAELGTLGLQEKRDAMSKIALKMALAQKTELDEAELIESTSLAITKEIRARNGLLIESRPGVFAFVHKSFLDYFAALEVGRTETVNWTALDFEVLKMHVEAEPKKGERMVVALLKSNPIRGLFLVRSLPTPSEAVREAGRGQLQEFARYLRELQSRWEANKSDESPLHAVTLIASDLMTFTGAASLDSVRSILEAHIDSPLQTSEPDPRAIESAPPRTSSKAQGPSKKAPSTKRAPARSPTSGDSSAKRGLARSPKS